MAGGDLIAQGSVGVHGGVGVDQDVDVGGTAGVVAGEEGLELCDTVRVRRPNSAQEGLVEVACVAAVAVSGSSDTRVHAGGVAVPHLEVDIGDGVTGLDIDDLVVNQRVDTLLGLADILADVLAADIVGALGDIGGQDAGRVAGEERGRAGVGGVAEASGVVVGGQNGVKVPLRLETALSTSGLGGPLATGNVAGLDATRLELVRAVAEVADLGVREVVAAFLELLSDGMARVSSCRAGKKGRNDSVGEAHDVGVWSEGVSGFVLKDCVLLYVVQQ